MATKTKFYRTNKFSKNSLSPRENQVIRVLATQLARSSYAARLGKSYANDRDLYEALGYRATLTYTDFYGMYKRQDIAKRIVIAPVQASWMRKPIVTDNEEGSEFDKAWEELSKKKKIFYYLARVDKISGIGEYGVLYLGFDDNKKPNEPVEGTSNELIFLRPYSQTNADIDFYVKDVKDERYGLPEFYKIQSSLDQTKSTQSNKVHWSRIIHVAEGLDESDVFGTPRLEEVFNRLQDLEKVAGGSGEMFWRGAFPGMVFKADDDASFSDDGQTKSALEEEIKEYIHGLKRYMKVQGLSVDQLEVSLADPTNHKDVLLELIAGAKGMPKRILVGSERGELASSQDEANWHTRIEERREDHAGPNILRPFVERLIQFGALPEPKEEFTITWPDLFSPSAQEKAEVAGKKMEALAKYAQIPDAQFILPVEEFYKIVFEWDEKKIESVMDIMAGYQEGESAIMLEDANATIEELQRTIDELRRERKAAEQ